MPRAAAGAPGLPVELRDAFGLTAAALDWAAALGAGTDPLQLEVSPRRRGALGAEGRGVVSRGGQGGARGYLFIYLFCSRPGIPVARSRRCPLGRAISGGGCAAAVGWTER